VLFGLSISMVILRQIWCVSFQHRCMEHSPIGGAASYTVSFGGDGTDIPVAADWRWNYRHRNLPGQRLVHHTLRRHLVGSVGVELDSPVPGVMMEMERYDIAINNTTKRVGHSLFRCSDLWGWLGWIGLHTCAWGL
jgi:hypothetical protein